MKKMALGVMTAAAVVASSTVALAIEATARVTFIDQEAGAILLNNSDMVTIPAGFDMATLKVGVLVTVTYDDTGNEPFTATALAVVPPPATPPPAAAPAPPAAAPAPPAAAPAPPAGAAPAAPAPTPAPPAGTPAPPAAPPAP